MLKKKLADSKLKDNYDFDATNVLLLQLLGERKSTKIETNIAQPWKNI